MTTPQLKIHFSDKEIEILRNIPSTRKPKSLSKKADLSDSFNHELYHGDEDQSDTARTSSLKVFGEASGTIEPGKGPLDDPAFGLDFELVGRVFYQLHIPCPANPSPLSGGMIGSVSP